MRSYTFVSVALAIVLSYTVCVNTVVVCPQENCIHPSKCDDSPDSNMSNFLCLNKQDAASCCSVVKEEFRTHCKHHGGECMSSCSSLLTRNAVDCSNNEVCCVLV
ncbi:uncharacterized protein LOC109854095 [Pseudomyrmex gracilis]|uniref:uncharacterized protein LOC109854095 n=1 Tax=Pseudomyrmex gracilis TaxID=219809 RepID=UPI000994ACEA|nr:uncharacterized protein LOC109854095 [Pseudomyrmex gracilis]